MGEQQGSEVKLPDPVEFSKSMADIAERSQKLVSDFLERQYEDDGGSAALDPYNVGGAFMEMTAKHRDNAKGSGQPTGKKQKINQPPPRLPHVGQIPHADAKQWAPPGFFVWRSLKVGAWNGHLEPYPRIGRSWSRYGEEESLRIVLTDLWTLHCEIEGIRQAG